MTAAGPVRTEEPIAALTEAARRLEEEINELLKAQVSRRKIARICKVDRNTLARYIKEFDLTNEQPTTNDQ